MSAPLIEALRAMDDRLSFHMPGHKGREGILPLRAHMDVTELNVTDDLYHAEGPILAAQRLMAKSARAAHTIFLINGSTCGVEAMLGYAAAPGERVILPRASHLSAISACALYGMEPVWVDAWADEAGAPFTRTEDVLSAIRQNPDARAVLLTRPDYFGRMMELGQIAEAAHAAGMLVLVDEAHGTHFYFGENFPISAMAAGADAASVSMHKSGGSLTQSSFLLMGKAINSDYMRQIVNLTHTTSASYLLLSSLDISRKRLALHGKEIFAKTVELAEYARSEINDIGGYYAFSKELINGDSVFDFDISKLSVHTLSVGLAGIEVYDLLRDEYDIQIEFGDIGNILAYLSVGDRKQDVERLISALAEIRRRFGKSGAGMLSHEYINPTVALSPRRAFYAEKESLPLEQTCGRICSEFVMCYPPGIPILAPGELITAEIIEYIKYAKEKGCSMTGTEDINIERLNVLKGV